MICHFLLVRRLILPLIFFLIWNIYIGISLFYYFTLAWPFCSLLGSVFCSLQSISSLTLQPHLILAEHCVDHGDFTTKVLCARRCQCRQIFPGWQIFTYKNYFIILMEMIGPGKSFACFYNSELHYREQWLLWSFYKPFTFIQLIAVTLRFFSCVDI